uniref:Uncharacterized protein n=1 Tax=Physcomitrium patens TaxID=3218 RepID=A0A2K1JPM4_PHYPA|nr:hypothetical protein PHYPA_015852 [Physcomitrium patens]
MCIFPSPNCELRILWPSIMESNSLCCTANRILQYFSCFSRVVLTCEFFLPSRPSSAIKAMASRTFVSSAVTILAVMSSVAAVANAQAVSPAPAPDSGAFSLVPSIVAPAIATIATIFATRMFW